MLNFKVYLRYLLLAVTFLIAGCSAKIDDYQGTEPRLDIFSYFQGNSQAWGMIQDYSNKQTRRFSVQIRGDVVADTLTLHEDFTYNDGEKQTRVWHIRRLADGSYQAPQGILLAWRSVMRRATRLTGTT